MRSVLEAIEWVLPALIRIFTASDKICVVEPPRPGTETAAKQATDYVNHIFYRDNPGFMILHDWFKDSLLEKVGWVKYWWDTQETVETQSYIGWTRQDYDAVVGQDPDVAVIKERRYTQKVDEFNMDRPVPAPIPVELYDVTLRVKRTNGRVRIENVPPEGAPDQPPVEARRHPVLVAPASLDLQRLAAAGFRRGMPRSGADWTTPRSGPGAGARHREDDDFPPYDRRDGGREIWVEESYCKLSHPGHDETELYQVTTAGNGLVILTKNGKPAIECVDEVPFVDICPIPAHTSWWVSPSRTW